MAELSVTQLDADTAKSVSTASASAGGDTFPNNGKTYLYVDNQDASDKTVTVKSPRDCSYGFNHDVQVTVSASSSVELGPFPVNRFTENVEVTYSDVTSVSVAAVSL